MENAIIFSLKPGLSRERQNAFLNTVRSWNGVVAVGRLNPKANDPNAIRTCFLYTNAARVETLAVRLKRDSNVETLSIQPHRYAAAAI